MNQEKIIKAGKIASEVKDFAKKTIKKDMLLLEIAEKVEEKIISLGGKIAFPTNLSIDNISAHYTPRHNDETKASGLLKIDLGVHIDGWVADTAFSIDLENNQENKKLIEASEEALKKATKIIKEKTTLSEIGKIIQETIESYGFSPIINLSGHDMKKYELHSGIAIPNIKNQYDFEIQEGIYAIEPFASNGSGKVRDGNPSGIYELRDERNVRNPIARDLLNFIIKEYKTLPFCSRWVVKKFGTKALFALKQLEENKNIHQFKQLLEINGSKVSQAENTLLVKKEKTIITTE